MKWLQDLLDSLFKPMPPLVPLPIPSAPEKPKPTPKKRAWDGEHADFQVWDEIVTDLVSNSKLPDLMPKDLLVNFPQYSKSREDRIEFYCQAISIMAKYESGFDPLQYYKEGFNDRFGNPVISRGLLQLSIESCNLVYKAKLNNEEELHDVRTNLRCAVLIFERWIEEDGVFSGGTIKNWKGGARYWSVLRDSSKSKPKIMEYLRSVYLDKSKVTIEQVREAIVQNMIKNVGQRETHGSNRSPLIDATLKRVGAALGLPYCAAAGWAAIDDACKELGLKNPVPKTASSQRMFTKAPEKYRKKKALKGDGGIMQQRKDPSKGHFYIVVEDQGDSKDHKTVEANTDPGGGREGDGWYLRTRSTDGDKTKSFRGFVDYATWIADHNRLGA